MKKILVLNGPNLDMLGVREPMIYGRDTLADLERLVMEHGEARGVTVICFQSNGEGELIEKIHDAPRAFDGIVYNPGAHTHYSYALRDAIGGIGIPCVEVHISDVDNREPFRRISVIAPVCVAQVKGRGFQGYCDAVDLLLDGMSERLGEGYERRYPAGQKTVGGRRTHEMDDTQGAKEEEDESDPAQLSQHGASKRRVDHMRTALAEAGMQAFFVRDTSNIAWLTAFDDVFDDEDAHALLVTGDTVLLHTDSRYAAVCGRAAEGTPVKVDATRRAHAEVAVKLSRSLVASAEKVMLGIEDSMTLAEYRRLEAALVTDTGTDSSLVSSVDIVETDAFVLGLRAVKEPSEIARMKAAQAITDAAFSHIIGFMRPGMTEREVQIELEDFMRRQGAESLAFPSIVATGVNGASPHAVPGATRLTAGQCVVMDFGARRQGYCSDMTRTVFVGQPDMRMVEAYTVLRQANERVEAALKPGVTGAEMHELAEQILDGGGFGAAMGHGLGHGVGIDIHEEPTLSPRNGRPLVAGNVVTVEPGIYLPGEFGMRLEDFGVLTDDGFQVFTQSSHEMIVI